MSDVKKNSAPLNVNDFFCEFPEPDQTPKKYTIGKLHESLTEDYVVSIKKATDEDKEEFEDVLATFGEDDYPDVTDDDEDEVVEEKVCNECGSKKPLNEADEEVEVEVEDEETASIVTDDEIKILVDDSATDAMKDFLAAYGVEDDALDTVSEETAEEDDVVTEDELDAAVEEQEETDESLIGDINVTTGDNTVSVGGSIKEDVDDEVVEDEVEDETTEDETDGATVTVTEGDTAEDVTDEMKDVDFSGDVEMAPVEVNGEEIPVDSVTVTQNDDKVTVQVEVDDSITDEAASEVTESLTEYYGDETIYEYWCYVEGRSREGINPPEKTSNLRTASNELKAALEEVITKADDLDHLKAGIGTITRSHFSKDSASDDYDSKQDLVRIDPYDSSFDGSNRNLVAECNNILSDKRREFGAAKKKFKLFGRRNEELEDDIDVDDALNAFDEDFDDVFDDVVVDTPATTVVATETETDDETPAISNETPAISDSCPVTTATKVMDAYQTANKWLDSVKEAVYSTMNCPFFSSYIHKLAHTMPERFDKFGDILHTTNLEIPYPATKEIDSKPANIGDAFTMIFRVLDGIKSALNEFIKCTETDYHGMSCAAEACLNDIESEYPMLYRLQGKWNECKDDTVTFDKYVMQYVEHKDTLVESLNEANEFEDDFSYSDVEEPGDADKDAATLANEINTLIEKLATVESSKDYAYIRTRVDLLMDLLFAFYHEHDDELPDMDDEHHYMNECGDTITEDADDITDEELATRIAEVNAKRGK